MTTTRAHYHRHEVNGTGARPINGIQGQIRLIEFRSIAIMIMRERSLCPRTWDRRRCCSRRTGEGELDKDEDGQEGDIKAGGNLLPSIRQRLSRLLQHSSSLLSSITLINGHTLFGYRSIASFRFVKFSLFSFSVSLFYVKKKKNVLGHRYYEREINRTWRSKREEVQMRTSYHSLERSGDYFRSVRSSSALLLPLCPEIMDTITLTRPQSLSR